MNFGPTASASMSHRPGWHLGSSLLLSRAVRSTPAHCDLADVIGLNVSNGSGSAPPTRVEGTSEKGWKSSLASGTERQVFTRSTGSVIGQAPRSEGTIQDVAPHRLPSPSRAKMLATIGALERPA